MNTINELLNNGIDINTAKRMLNSYSKRIDTMNGIYRIIDINYDFSIRGKDITLECTNCGNIIHKTMINGKNKWSELVKNCDCQKAEKQLEKQRISENSEKIKKAAIINRVGEIFGDFEIVSVEDMGDKPKYYMRCTECGAEKIISVKGFEQRKDFHCRKHYEYPIKYDESYIGKKNNFLTVIGISRLENGHRAFVCQCDCGNIKKIEPTIWEQGYVQSCGCKHGELIKESSTTHGCSGDRLYKVWNSMKQRCYNNKTPNYKNYGGRGIKICNEWLNDFECFRKWALENGYDYNAKFGECTIDRIDVNGNYEPENCRWADYITQANNRRPREQKAYEFNGTTRPLEEWCSIYETSQPAIAYRMKILGMTFEQALTTPKMTNGRPRKEAL